MILHLIKFEHENLSQVSIIGKWCCLVDIERTLSPVEANTRIFLSIFKSHFLSLNVDRLSHLYKDVQLRPVKNPERPHILTFQRDLIPHRSFIKPRNVTILLLTLRLTLRIRTHQFLFRCLILRIRRVSNQIKIEY